MALLQSNRHTKRDLSLAKLAGKTLLHLLLVIACSPIIAIQPQMRRYMLEHQWDLRQARRRLSAE